MSDHEAGFRPGTPSTHSKTLTLRMLGVRSPKVNAASSMWSTKISKNNSNIKNIVAFTQMLGHLSVICQSMCSKYWLTASKS